MIIKKKQSPIMTYLSIFGVLVLHGGILKLLFTHHKPITNDYSVSKIEVTFATLEQIEPTTNKLPSTQSSPFDNEQDPKDAPVIQSKSVKSTQNNGNQSPDSLQKQNVVKASQVLEKQKDTSKKIQKKKQAAKEKSQPTEKNAEKKENKSEKKSKTEDKNKKVVDDTKDHKNAVSETVKKKTDADKKSQKKPSKPKENNLEEDIPDTLSPEEIENLKMAEDPFGLLNDSNENEVIETVGDKQELADEIAKDQNNTATSTADTDNNVQTNIVHQFSEAEAQWDKPYSEILPIEITQTIIESNAFQVKVELKIDEQGKVVSAKKLKSSGNTAIDKFALTDIKKARFKPFKRNGVAVTGVITLPIIYTAD